MRLILYLQIVLKINLKLFYKKLHFSKINVF